jgi:hypothetical protein
MQILLGHYFSGIQNKMVATLNLYLAFGSMVITCETLGLHKGNTLRINIPTH